MSSIAVCRIDDPADFERAAGPFLLEREAEHNLILGLLALFRDGRLLEQPPYFAVAERDGEVVAAAMRTPPRGLLLSRIEDPEAVDGFVDDAPMDLPGVLGDVESSKRFADLWSVRRGVAATVVMSQRIHSADHAVHPQGVPGEMRDATEGDRDVLAQWAMGFGQEAMGGREIRDRAEADAFVDARLGGRTSGLVVWWDGGQPVSMAGSSGPTPNGIRVNAVYTPPEYRGRGYASACVAALTQRLLDDGRRYCFLYTDLANPTSNAIYRRIGYEPVCDVDEYAFG